MMAETTLEPQSLDRYRLLQWQWTHSIDRAVNGRLVSISARVTPRNRGRPEDRTIHRPVCSGAIGERSGNELGGSGLALAWRRDAIPKSVSTSGRG